MTFNKLNFICPKIFAPSLHRCLSMMLQTYILLYIQFAMMVLILGLQVLSIFLFSLSVVLNAKQTKLSFKAGQYIHVVHVLGRLKQEGCKFEASQRYLARLWSKYFLFEIEKQLHRVKLSVLADVLKRKEGSHIVAAFFKLPAINGQLVVPQYLALL